MVTGNWTVESRYFLLIFGGHAPHAGSTLASSMQVRYYSCKIAGHIVQPSRVAGAPSSTIWYLLLCTGTLFYTCLLGGKVGERGTAGGRETERDKRVLQLRAKISSTTPSSLYLHSTSQTYTFNPRLLHIDCLQPAVETLLGRRAFVIVLVCPGP